jgi:hypothetical protein
MPIDYSQPGYKEMFANYGLTAIAALALEKSHLLLTVAIDNLGNESLPKKMLHEYLESSQNEKPMKKKEMGKLIKEVKTRLYISASLEADFDKARICVTISFITSLWKNTRLFPWEQVPLF